MMRDSGSGSFDSNNGDFFAYSGQKSFGQWSKPKHIRRVFYLSALSGS